MLSAILPMIGESGKSLNKWLAKHEQVTKDNDDTDHIDELRLEPTTELIGCRDPRERKLRIQNWLSAECITLSEDLITKNKL